MLHVTFLAHSGFLVEDGKRCYVFDYYKDPNNIVWQLAKRGRELWFFVSHTHGDHFNPSITEFDGPQTRYICHQDVPLSLIHIYVLRAALQVVGTKPGLKTVSSSMFMFTSKKEYGDDGMLVFSDCGVLPNPTSEQLADIAESTVEKARKVVGMADPRVSMLLSLIHI